MKTKYDIQEYQLKTLNNWVAKHTHSDKYTGPDRRCDDGHTRNMFRRSAMLTNFINNRIIEWKC